MENSLLDYLLLLLPVSLAYRNTLWPQGKRSPPPPPRGGGGAEGGVVSKQCANAGVVWRVVYWMTQT